MRNQIKQKTKINFNIDGRISLYDYFDEQVLVVNLITNIFHRGGIFHTTETKIGAQKTFGLLVLIRSY